MVSGTQRMKALSIRSMLTSRKASDTSSTGLAVQPVVASPHLLLPTTPQCLVCGATDHLSKCASCRIASYCCRDHQISDCSSQKQECNVVKRKAAAMEREESALRAFRDISTKGDPFTTKVGVFWKIPAAQQYLKLRMDLVKANLKQNSREAAESALQHSQDLLRLSRYDKYRLRSLMPALYLRLGRDQETYDFIKWFYFADQDCQNDCTPTSPFLVMKGENAF